MATILYESYYGVDALTTDYLAHHGIKGQRWGIRRTPEQLGHFAKETFKTAKSKIEKGREAFEAKRAERVAAAKKKAIEKGQGKKIYKFRDELTTQELQDAVNRVRLNAQLKDLSFKRRSITDILNTAAQFNNAVANTADSIKRVKTLFKSKAAKEAEEAEKAYKENRLNAAKKAANDARKNADGSFKNREDEARKAFLGVLNGKDYNPLPEKNNGGGGSKKKKNKGSDGGDEKNSKPSVTIEDMIAKAQNIPRASVNTARNRSTLAYKNYNLSERLSKIDTSKRIADHKAVSSKAWITEHEPGKMTSKLNAFNKRLSEISEEEEKRKKRGY